MAEEQHDEDAEGVRESDGLIDFLLEHPQENVTATIRLSQRFTEKGHRFTIKALTFGELEEYRKEARAAGNRKTGEMNIKRLNELIVLNHLVDPNLKDKRLLDKAGLKTAESFLYKFFKPGEISELVNQITTLSGYDADEESAIEEVKG